MRFDTEKVWLNGIQVQPSNTYFVNVTGLKSFTKQNTTSDLISDGEYLGNTKLEPRTINIVAGTLNRFDIVNDFRLNQILSCNEILLKFKLKGFDEILETYITVESSSEDEISGFLSVVCKAYDPYLYKENYSKIELKMNRENPNFILNNPFTINTFDFTSEVISGVENEIYNNSFSIVYPMIYIEGEGDTFSIENETTGEELNINYALLSGQMIVVDCNLSTRSIYLVDEHGKQSNLITHKTGQFLKCISGSNKIKTRYNGACNITVKWREGYI